MIVRSSLFLCAIFLGAFAADWCCAQGWPERPTVAPATERPYAWGELPTPPLRRSSIETPLPQVAPISPYVTDQRGVVYAAPPASATPPRDSGPPAPGAKRLPPIEFDVEKVAYWQYTPEEDETYWDDGYEDASRFDLDSPSQPSRIDIGFDLYSPPDFDQGLVIYGDDIAMKIGGYVKADFIYDFDAIGSTDFFDTTTIPTDEPPRTNARYHAKQSRITLDTRWASGVQVVRIYIEGDFFGTGDQFRLRHAYGESGQVLVGRTWTTFTDVAAVPATLDFEGSVSSVNRRQAQARWTVPIYHEDVTMSLAVEDTRFIIETPMGITGEARSPSPDFVARVRLDKDWAQFQIASLYRIVGFQPTGGDVITASAWGFNFTGAMLVTPRTKAYYQVVFGEGIGSYRGLPDAAPSTLDVSQLLPLFGWMVGVTHDWHEGLSSNFTYAENSLDNAAAQDGDDVHRTTYLAVNLIWNPLDRVNVGIEYLHGIRENVDRDAASANRLQMAFIFDLP